MERRGALVRSPQAVGEASTRNRVPTEKLMGHPVTKGERAGLAHSESKLLGSDLLPQDGGIQPP